MGTVTSVKRLMAIVGAVALAVALVVPVHAAKPVPFAWTLTWQVFQAPVEQEPGFVNNPTGCDWDVDDSTQWEGFGSTPVGQPFSKTFCVIADGYDNTGGDQHRVEVRVVAGTPDVSVSLTNDRGVSYSFAPTASGNKDWVWLFCERDTTDYQQPVSFYPVIADSNGGTGEIVNYTVTATLLAKGNMRINTSTGNSGPWMSGCP